MTSDLSIEQKSLITDIANGFIKLFKVDKFKSILTRFLKKEYGKGIDEIEKKFDFNVSFGNQQRDTSMLEKYTFDNIKELTEELQDKLRQELSRGLMGNETPKELRKRISKIFKGNNPTRFKYENRIKMITHTEMKRASNMAKFSGAQELIDDGVKLYKYTELNPKDPCPICKEISEGKPIPFDSFFVHGKTREKYPPFHPNCLCNLVITQNKDL